MLIIINIVEITENAMDVLKALLTSAGDCLVHS
jgi:hypothetical protein